MSSTQLKAQAANSKIRKSSRPKKPSKKVRGSPVDDVLAGVVPEKDKENVREKLLAASSPVVVNRDRGKCSSMGDACGNPTLERSRHFCVGCGDGVHSIAPCGIELSEEEGGGVSCMICYRKNHSENHSTDGDVSESKEEIVDSDSDDDEDSIVIQRKTKSSSGDTVLQPVKLNVGRCPANGPYCLARKERWGDIHCDACGLPVHRSVVCSTHDKSLGKTVCKSCEETGSRSPANAESETEPPEAAVASKSNRGPNFSQNEDILLTKAWVAVSADSRNGTGQKLEVFTEKLKKALDDLIVDWNSKCHLEDKIPFRDAKSIMYRWTNHIRPDCSKWSATCKAIKKGSGEDIEQVTARRMAFYTETHGKGKPFRFLECYGFLEDLPKWAEIDEAKDKTGKKRGATTKKREGKQKEQRTIGKRQKALNDKAAKIAQQVNGVPGVPSSGQEPSDGLVSALTKELSSMSKTFRVNEWSISDQREYFAKDARIQMLEQEKQILLLQQQVNELKKKNKKSEATEPAEQSSRSPSDESSIDSETCRYLNSH